MDLDKLYCASLLTYSPRGKTSEELQSQSIRYALKGGKLIGPQSISVPRWVAETVSKGGSGLPIAHFFEKKPTLVPVPRSTLTRKGGLWVPLQIAEELDRLGLGGGVAPILTRHIPIPQAATSIASDRPLARRHFETMAVQTGLVAPSCFLLVDDFVTRGATLLGAANRLLAGFPDTQVKAFAAIRTVSNPEEFTKIVDPKVELIRLREDGTTLRRAADWALPNWDDG